MVKKKSRKASFSSKKAKLFRSSKKKSANSKPSKVNVYRNELLNSDKSEARYDKIFEQKLSTQYKDFRNLKEHATQSRAFLRILIVIITIILIALLILSYNM